MSGILAGLAVIGEPENGGAMAGSGALSLMPVPSLDLWMARDKAFTVDEANPGGCLITSRRGPDAKFSRASGRTFTDSDGLVKWAAENLFSNSSFGSPWTETECDVVPSSEAGVVEIISSAAVTSHFLLSETVSVMGSTYHTVRVRVKAGSREWVGLDLAHPSVANYKTWFHLSGAGSVGTSAVGNVPLISLDADGFYQISVTRLTAPAQTSTFSVLVPGSADSMPDFAGDGVTVDLYASRAQLNRGTTPCQHLPTTSAPVYGPAFEHDPVTGVCLGLSRWEQRTNWQTQSNDFAAPIWGLTAFTATANATTSPSGQNDGWLFSGFDDASSIYSFAAHSGAPLTTPIAISFYLKQVSPAGVITASSVYGVGFGLWEVNLALVSSVAWQRITSTHPAVTVITPFTATNDASSILLQKKAGSAVGGLSFYIYGAQFEVGTSPSSYIPTTTAAVVRSADVCDITGSDFAGFYNQSEGTVVVTFTAPLVGTTGVFSINNGTASERLEQSASGTNPQFVAVDGGVIQSSLDAGTLIPYTTHKLAISWKANEFATCLDGGAVVTDTSGTMPTPDRLLIGITQAGESLNGEIARLEYRPKALPAKLQTLSI